MTGCRNYVDLQIEFQLQALRAEHQSQAVPGIESAPTWQGLRSKSSIGRINITAKCGQRATQIA